MLFAGLLLAANAEKASASLSSFGSRIGILNLLVVGAGDCGPCEEVGSKGQCESLCEDDQECVDDECKTPCTDNDDCADECGAKCEKDGYCGEPKCKDGEICDEGECKDPCEDVQCDSGMECVEGECKEKCDDADPCECNAECGKDGFCGEPNCPDETACIEGECLNMVCKTDADCPECYVCEDGECEEKPKPEDGCEYCCKGGDWALDAPNACYHECVGGEPEQKEDPANPYDGCSVPPEFQGLDPAPRCSDKASGKEYFKPSCMDHDGCYRSDCDAGKDECDDNFLDDMKEQCESDFDENEASNPTAYNKSCFDDCVDKAQAYAVVMSNKKAKEAFDKGHACCKENGPCS